MDIFDLRRDFSLKTLNEKDVDSNPIKQFDTWFKEAMQAKVLEPNAMMLSTATLDGKPSARTVLLKQFSKTGFVFFTNYNSDKGVQLRDNPYCALTFVWHELERQVRIEGIARKVSPKQSDQYFEVRPERSKLGAWASPQSQVIVDRQYLEMQMLNFFARFAGEEITRPDDWGGYIVKPHLIEFWQGRSNRLHDRLRYRLDSETWLIERLAP